MSSSSNSGHGIPTTGMKEMETSPGSESESVLTYRSPFCVQQHLSVAAGVSPPPPVSLMTPLTAEAQSRVVTGQQRVDVTPSGGTRSLLYAHTPLNSAANDLMTNTASATTTGLSIDQSEEEEESMEGQQGPSLSVTTIADLTPPTFLPNLQQSSSLIVNPDTPHDHDDEDDEEEENTASPTFTQNNNALTHQYSSVMPTTVPTIASATPNSGAGGAEGIASPPPSSSAAVVTATATATAAVGSGNGTGTETTEEDPSRPSFSSTSGVRSRRLDGVAYRNFRWSLSVPVPASVSETSAASSSLEGIHVKMENTTSSPGATGGASGERTTPGMPVAPNVFSTPSHSSSSSSNFQQNQSAPAVTMTGNIVIVNHKEVTNYVKIDPRLSKLQHCVMCGNSGKVVKIPSQNKNICGECDSSFWFFIPWEVVIKFCKGCKNFFLLEEFSEKPEGTKCKKCRQRGRENYLTKKQNTSSCSSSGAAVNNEGGEGGLDNSVMSNQYGISCLAGLTTGAESVAANLALPTPSMSSQHARVPIGLNLNVNGESQGVSVADGLVRTYSQGSLSVDLEMITATSDAGSLSGGMRGLNRSHSNNTNASFGPLDQVLVAAAQFDRQRSVGSNHHHHGLSMSLLNPSETGGYFLDQPSPHSGSAGHTPNAGGPRDRSSSQSKKRKAKAIDTSSPTNHQHPVVSEHHLHALAGLDSSSGSPSKAKLNVLANTCQMMLEPETHQSQTDTTAHLSQNGANNSSTSANAKKRPPRGPSKKINIGTSGHDTLDSGYGHPDSAKSIGCTSYFFNDISSSTGTDPMIPPAPSSSSSSSASAAVGTVASSLIEMATPQGNDVTPASSSSSSFRAGRLFPLTGESALRIPHQHELSPSFSGHQVTAPAAVSTTPRGNVSSLNTSSLSTPFANTGNHHHHFAIPNSLAPINQTPDSRRVLDLRAEHSTRRREEEVRPAHSDNMEYANIHDVMSGHDSSSYQGRYGKMRKRYLSLSGESPRQQHQQQEQQRDGDQEDAVHDQHQNVATNEVKKMKNDEEESSLVTHNESQRRQFNEWDPQYNPLMALAMVTPGNNKGDRKEMESEIDDRHHPTTTETW
jgi:hypothetical protein